MRDGVPEAIPADVVSKVYQRGGDILPGDTHGLRTDVKADSVYGLQHFLGLALMHERADIDA
jgi:hypothetical protein